MGGHRAGFPRPSLWTATLIVLHASGQKQPWVLLTDTPVAQTEPTLYACRNWIEQGFRGMKTVGWKWHRTRRLDPTRVGRHWLVLAMATLLAVAYGTRHEDAEARHREPGRLRRPPAELTAAQQDALPPASPQPVAAGRGAAAPLAAARLSVGLCVAATYARPRLPHPEGPRPAPGGSRRHLNLTRAVGAGPASHSSIALSTPRPPRSSAPRGPPHQQFCASGA